MMAWKLLNAFLKVVRDYAFNTVSRQGKKIYFTSD